jgi:hypothetical protein
MGDRWLSKRHSPLDDAPCLLKKGVEAIGELNQLSSIVDVVRFEQVCVVTT